MRANKTARIGLRLTDREREAIERVAAATGKKTSRVVRDILDHWLEKNERRLAA